MRRKGKDLGIWYLSTVLPISKKREREAGRQTQAARHNYGPVSTINSNSSSNDDNTDSCSDAKTTMVWLSCVV